MPFKSKRQWRAAMSGHISGIPPEKAKEWARETKVPFRELPDRAEGEKGKPTLRSKSASNLRVAIRSGGHSFRAAKEEISRGVGLNLSPNTMRSNLGAASIEKAEHDQNQEEQRRKWREAKRAWRARQKQAGASLLSLTTKLALVTPSLVPQATKPSGMRSVTSANAARASQIGAFKGKATASSLKPPGSTKTLSMNPRRNLKQAITAFKA